MRNRRRESDERRQPVVHPSEVVLLLVRFVVAELDAAGVDGRVIGHSLSFAGLAASSPRAGRTIGRELRALRLHFYRHARGRPKGPTEGPGKTKQQNPGKRGRDGVNKPELGWRQ